MPEATPRRTFSASQRYWDVLDRIIADGRAANLSEAFRYVIDEYERSQRRHALADSARRLDDDDWATLSGLTTSDDPGDDEAPPWSQLIDET